jgi:transposase
LNAYRVFIDESGFLMAPLVRRTWAPRGQTPILLQRGRSHQKVSAIAALVVSPRRHHVRLFFRLHPHVAIKAPLIRDFLCQLSRHLSGRAIIIWDRLNTHRARVVTHYLVSKPRLAVEYFPPYAPELNPVEYVWGYLKTNPLANRPELDIDALLASTRHHTRCLQHKPRLLRSFLYSSSLFSPV